MERAILDTPSTPFRTQIVALFLRPVRSVDLVFLNEDLFAVVVEVEDALEGAGKAGGYAGLGVAGGLWLWLGCWSWDGRCWLVVVSFECSYEFGLVE